MDVQGKAAFVQLAGCVLCLAELSLSGGKEGIEDPFQECFRFHTADRLEDEVPNGNMCIQGQYGALARKDALDLCVDVCRPFCCVCGDDVFDHHVYGVDRGYL